MVSTLQWLFDGLSAIVSQRGCRLHPWVQGALANSLQSSDRHACPSGCFDTWNIDVNIIRSSQKVRNQGPRLFMLPLTFSFRFIHSNQQQEDGFRAS